ncbi:MULTISPECIES: dynamin family protein [unclassified Psychrobacter]|uniref:dynamin family protein n=1 Tax=unclassified Psychrobacter TaxID=196806 RepID=UPI00259A4AF2|nr:dynamin family protein [uncultured Psychrobacter sp.]
MTKKLSEQSLLDTYRHLLDNVLRNYPALENGFDISLKKDHLKQMEKNDEHLQEIKLDFLNFLQEKYNHASGIIDNLQSYTSNTNSEKSEFDKFISDSKSLNSEILATKNDISQPFSLYVIGAGKAGKSTLINALVGQDVATVGVLPKTWKVDRFFDADTKQAILHYKDGSPIRITNQKEAKEIVQAEEKKRKDSEKDILAKRREHYRLYPNLTLEEKEGITRNLNDLYLYRSNIRQIEWAIDVDSKSKSILNKFSIIDTPGVGQNHSGKDAINYVGEDVTAFSQADGMIWVLDATTLAAATPEALLRDFEETSDGVTTTNKIAVLNRIDLIRNATGDEGVKRAEQAAKKLLGGFFTKIIPFSAKDAFEAVINNDEDKLYRSGYDEIFKGVNHVFAKESTNRISQKSDRLNKNLMHRYARDLSPYIERLAVDETLLNTSYRLLEESLRDLQTDLGNAKINFLDAYKTEVESYIDNYAASYLDIVEDRERNTFLNEHIFKIEDMQQGLNRLLNNNQQYTSDFITGQKKLNNKKFKRFKHLSETLYPMAIGGHNKKSSALTMNASDISFSGEDETSMLIGGGLAVAGMILLGPIGLLAGAADVFFGFSKGRKINATKSKLTQHLTENILAPISEQIDSVFQKLLDNAEKEIKESLFQIFSELHFEPTPSNFKHVKQLTTQLKEELNLTYKNNQKIPEENIQLKPSLSLYLLRQKNANKA